ncbi:MAG: type II toxin-antitoxin system PemK/MazF family toxin [Catonella sp.]|uniref:type II toxin-antitoxin system PemK/MazF family toxin n=1 Tax=Catonella sp. TaxID=2382125 RepID=UPI003F9F8C66
MKLITPDMAQSNVKETLKVVENTLNSFLTSDNPNDYKKVHLISDWLKVYSKYILLENKFDYTKTLRFHRGSVINVNFGFNVGSEHGGMHFAVVLDNNNAHSSPVITVLPMSSSDGKKVNKRDIYIGSELHDQLQAKNNTELLEVTKFIEINNRIITLCEEVTNHSEITEIKRHLEDLKLVNKEQHDLLKKLQNNKLKIDNMKSGSVVLMEQITTISKMRIYNPRYKGDFLQGIKLSTGAMDKINVKLRELYLH